MFGHGEVDDRYGRIRAADVTSLDFAGLDALMVDVSGVESYLNAVKVRMARQAEALKTSPAGGGAADVLIDRGRKTRGEAQKETDRSRACDEMPGFEDALATGDLGAAHIDAFARVTKNLDAATKDKVAEHADDLIATAANTTVGEFDKHCQNLIRHLTSEAEAISKLERQRRSRKVSRSVDRDTGMRKTHISLDAESDAKLWTAIDAHLATLRQREGNADVSFDELTVEALLELVKANSSKFEPKVPEVYVHVDLKTLTEGVHEYTLSELTDGSPLALATVQRLCCEATIVGIVMTPDGKPMDCGREYRTASRKQRRALRSIYRTCGGPYCDTPFDQCHIHHVLPWLDLGDTNLDNLVPLCSRHHHLVHEGGWRLTMTADRVLTFVMPEGQVYFSGDTCDRPTGQPPADARSGAPPGRRTAAA